MSASTVEWAAPRVRRARLAGWVSRNRALTAAAAAWVVSAANFNHLVLDYLPDPARPYAFLQSMFGDATGRPDAYQFGLSFAWAPFYALGKLFVSLTGIHAIRGHPAVPAFVAISAGVFVLGAGAALAPVLRGLRVRHAAFALVCAVFGTPLYYYGTFNPGQTHALETFLLSAVVAVLFMYFRRETPSPWLPVAIGLLLAWAITVRYFMVFPALALVLGLVWYRRWRDALLVAATPVIGLALAGLAAYEVSGDPLRGAATGGEGGVGRAFSVLVFAPLNPYRMLLTEERGLFLWTPVALLGAIGFVYLLRRRPDERPFLAICSAMAVATILSYTFSPHWQGGGPPEFSQRYLTSLFPYIALGLAGLLEWRALAAAVASTLAVGWALLIGVYSQLGMQAVARPTQPLASILHGNAPLHLTAYNLYRISNLHVLIPDPFQRQMLTGEQRRARRLSARP